MLCSVHVGVIVSVIVLFVSICFLYLCFIIMYIYDIRDANESITVVITL